MEDLLQVGAITNTHGVHGEVKVFPGHGNGTTIGDEKKYNPFCQ